MVIKSSVTPGPLAFVLETGKLCAAWSYLEVITDRIIWGYLGVNEQVGSLITSQKDLPTKWKMIVGQIKPHVTPEEFEVLRSINKAMQCISDDRNIVVHGQIVTRNNQAFATVTRGSNAGKFFPVTLAAVELIIGNIKAVAEPAKQIAGSKGWLLDVNENPEYVSNWPKPISI